MELGNSAIGRPFPFYRLAQLINMLKNSLTFGGKIDWGFNQKYRPLLGNQLFPRGLENQETLVEWDAKRL